MYHFKLFISIEEKVGLKIKFINFFLENESNKISLFKVALDEPDNLNWFIENELFIRNDKPPFYENYSSIAEIIDKFYEEVDVDEFNKIEAMFSFRKTHAIRFAFRGQDLDDIYIGLNKKFYEISCHENNNNWKYIVDIDSLFFEIKNTQTHLETIK